MSNEKCIRKLNMNEHGGPERFVFGRRLDDNRRMSYLPGFAQKRIYHSDKHQDHNGKKNIERNISQAPFIEDHTTIHGLGWWRSAND